MENKKPRKRLVVEIDPSLAREVRREKAETARPMNRIVEEALAQRYHKPPPAIGGAGG